MPTYLQLLAESSNKPSLDHPWCQIMESSLRNARPAEYDRLAASGELEACIQWKTGAMLTAYDVYKEDGYDDEQAKELAFDDWLPKVPSVVAEDYEIEGQQADEVQALENHFGL